VATAEEMRTYVTEYWRRRGWRHTRVAMMPDHQVLAIYKDTIARPDLHHYVSHLAGTRCTCGEGKRAGHPFCLNCYERLPADMRRALYRKLEKGFETAFDQAVSYLERR